MTGHSRDFRCETLRTGKPAVTVDGDVVEAGHLIPRRIFEDAATRMCAQEEARDAAAMWIADAGRTATDEIIESWLWFARVEAVPDGHGNRLVTMTPSTHGSDEWTHALFASAVRTAPVPPAPIRAFFAPLGTPLPSGASDGLDRAFTEVGWISDDGLSSATARDNPQPETLRTLKTSAAATMTVTWTSPRTAAFYRLFGLPVPYGLSKRRSRMTQREFLAGMRSAYGRRRR
jgi:hypothetical protein